MIYNIKFTLQELQIVANAIGQRPYQEVVTLLANIQKQVAEQEKTEDAPTVV